MLLGVLLGLTACGGSRSAPSRPVDGGLSGRRARTIARPTQRRTPTAGTPRWRVMPPRVPPRRPAVRPPADMLRVPGGSFRMGADAGGEPDERPAHRVTLKTFWLDRTEVTNAAYRRCALAKVCRWPSPKAWHRGARLPVTGVTWFDAAAYCRWRGKRLPREAEFERAVRGDDGRRYPWGDARPTPALTVALDQRHPAPVGSRPRGRGPYGHDDLLGNVWEWMADAYDPYAYRRAGAARGEPGTCAEIRATQDELRRTGRQGFTGSNPIPTQCERVLRGGAYNYPAEWLRSTNRVHHPAHWHIKVAGFRCAWSPP